MTEKTRRLERLFYCLMSALVAITLPVRAAEPNKTIVADTIYRADGSTAKGTLLISWPAFSTTDGKPVAAGTLSVKIGANGSIHLPLIPTQGATPSGAAYKVVLALDDGSSSTEYWSVPALSPTTIAAIRATEVPATVAMQVVSRDYVDSQLATAVRKNGDETISGSKIFDSSPLVPPPGTDAAAANKGYVDVAVAAAAPTPSNVLSINKGGTGTNVFTPARCVRVTDDGMSLESSSSDCGGGGTSGNADTVDGMHAVQLQPALANAATLALLGTPTTAGTQSTYNGTTVDWQSKAMLDVRDYGAKCDGTTDDTAAIRAALTAAAAKNNGRTIVIPGRCKVVVPNGGVAFQIDAPDIRFVGVGSQRTNSGGGSGFDVYQGGASGGAVFQLWHDTQSGNLYNQSYDGPASGFGLEHLYVRCYDTTYPGNLDRDPSIHYCSNMTAIKDWRSGSVYLNDAWIEFFQYGFWGVASDWDVFTNVRTGYNKTSFYFGPWSENFSGRALQAGLNGDVAFELEMPSHWVCDSCTVAFIGGGGHDPIYIHDDDPGGNSHGTNVVFNQPWLEYGGFTSPNGPPAAFFQLGKSDGTGLPISGLEINNPRIINSGHGVGTQVASLLEFYNSGNSVSVGGDDFEYGSAGSSWHSFDYLVTNHAGYSNVTFASNLAYGTTSMPYTGWVHNVTNYTAISAELNRAGGADGRYFLNSAYFAAGLRLGGTVTGGIQFNADIKSAIFAAADGAFYVNYGTGCVTCGWTWYAGGTTAKASVDNAGKGTFNGGLSTGTLATGTAPITTASTTLNANLNADMVDGKHASDFLSSATVLAQTNTCAGSDKFSGYNAATGAFTCAADQTGSGGSGTAQKIASGTAALGTSSIAANSCAAAVTVSAAGVLTSDVISWTANADITGVTGYTPGGTLKIYPYPTAGNVNFKVCNADGTNAVTPGAVTLNWEVTR